MAAPCRTFVGVQVHTLAALPFAPPAPVAGVDGGQVAHRLLAAGGWSQDAQSYLLSCLDLTITLPPAAAAPAAAPAAAAVAEVAAWRPPARVTCSAAGAPAPGAALLVAGTADGSLCRLRLRVPTAPGASAADAELDDGGGADHDGAALVPWRGGAHGGAVTAVALDEGATRVASGGADGSIVVTDVAAPRGEGVGSGATTVAPPSAAASVVDVAWRSAADVAAATAGGGVALWDCRAATTAAAARAPPPATPADAATRVAVAPARPHALAVGTRGGRVEVFDVRALTRGAVASAALPATPRPEGPVTALTFDTLPSLHGDPPALFTTAGGALARAGLVDGVANETATLLFRERCGAAVALALDGGGHDAVVATEAECLVYLRR